jgi:hypothetical protein
MILKIVDDLYYRVIQNLVQTFFISIKSKIWSCLNIAFIVNHLNKTRKSNPMAYMTYEHNFFIINTKTLWATRIHKCNL